MIKDINIYEYFKDDIRYKKQFFFLSKEIDLVKTYFSGLYNNNNINDHFNTNNYDFKKLAQQISVLTNNSQHYDSIMSMLKTDEALKVIIIFLFKGFSWNNEIYNEFDISSKLYIVNTIATLNKLDLLISEKGISLHPILYDSIKKTKGIDVRKSLHQAKIYFINPMFIKFCELLTPLFEFKIKNSINTKHSLYQTMINTKMFTKKLESVIYEESNQLTRHHQDDSGLIYETKTLKAIESKSIIKKALSEVKVEFLENKREEGLLTNKQSKLLQLVNTSKNSLCILEDPKINNRDKKNNIIYKNKIISKSEYDRLIQEQDEKDNIIAKSNKEFPKGMDLSLFSEQKQIVEKNFKSINNDDELERIEPLILYIKSQEKVHVDKIAKNLRLYETYNIFLDRCIEEKINTDNEFFYYTQMTAEQEADLVFSKFKK